MQQRRLGARDNAERRAGRHAAEPHRHGQERGGVGAERRADGQETSDVGGGQREEEGGEEVRVRGDGEEKAVVLEGADWLGLHIHRT